MGSKKDFKVSELPGDQWCREHMVLIAKNSVAVLSFSFAATGRVTRRGE